MAKPGRRSRYAPKYAPAWEPRRKRVYALTDQGAPIVLDSSDFGIEGRDRSWNAQARNFITANRPYLSALAVTPELIATGDSINLRLRPGGTVGAVPVRAPDTRKVAAGLVVRPRFGWDGIGPLLERVGWAAQPHILETPLVPGSAREVPPWVLAGPILGRLSTLLREVRRGFRLREAVRETPRGQILWHRYVNDQIVRGAFHRIPCRFSDLTPDTLLRSYIRWGVEAVLRALKPFLVIDAVARRLGQSAQELLFDLRDTRACPPDRRTLELLLRGVALPSESLSKGLQALGWIVEERGLAGRSESDGLAWALPMHSLFERWVEHIVRAWAAGFGGQVRSGYAQQTTVPVRWKGPVRSSITSLIPDVVVTHANGVCVIDAKYKGHFQELDESRWMALAEELRAEHRHDVHQVLAYAALFDAREVTSLLVYPMHTRTWSRLAAVGKTLSTGVLASGERTVTLALAGIPMVMPIDYDVRSLTRDWESLVPF
jgi:hypothetical protein